MNRYRIGTFNFEKKGSTQSSIRLRKDTIMKTARYYGNHIFEQRTLSMNVFSFVCLLPEADNGIDSTIGKKDWNRKRYKQSG